MKNHSLFTLNNLKREIQDDEYRNFSYIITSDDSEKLKEEVQNIKELALDGNNEISWFVCVLDASNNESLMNQLLTRIKKIVHIDDYLCELSAEYAVGIGLQALKEYDISCLFIIENTLNTQSSQQFSSAYQIWLTKNLPVSLVITGKIDKIRELQNAKGTTFLWRCMRIDLDWDEK